MLRKLAIAFVTIVVLGIAPAATGAAWAGAFGEMGGHGLGYRSGITGRSRPASHLEPGGGYAGINHRYGSLGHESSGWYNRGWGGTTSPGWGYGFGPNLGGSGH
jgi:hypothetical protein